MDMSRPGSGGLEATKQISAFFRSLAFIVLSVHKENPIPAKGDANGRLCYLTERILILKK